MAAAPPTERRLALSSGVSIPALGLGTFQATAPGEVGAAVKAAIRAGYRLIDCAAGYGNQKEIGEALAEVFAEGTVKRPPPVPAPPPCSASPPPNPTP